MTSSTRKYDFTGKVALVTGSSAGIGAAIALDFARNGARLTITGRDAEALAEVAKKVEALSGEPPLQLVGDLLDDAFTGKLIPQTIAKFGQLDILVNNAGHSTTGGHLSSPDMLTNFDRLFKLNVRTPVRLTQEAVPHLEVTQGNIVNISSVVALKPYQLVYGSSKAALDMITKTSALELGPKGIRVNSVNPGAVATRFGRSIGDEGIYEKFAEMIIKNTALQRVATAEEIAPLVTFLASNDARNITGSIMVNDSGSLLK